MAHSVQQLAHQFDGSAHGLRNASANVLAGLKLLPSDELAADLAASCVPLLLVIDLAIAASRTQLGTAPGRVPVAAGELCRTAGQRVPGLELRATSAMAEVQVEPSSAAARIAAAALAAPGPTPLDLRVSLGNGEHVAVHVASRVGGPVEWLAGFVES